MNSSYWKNRRQERRKRLLKLLGAKCKICGSSKGLHFDHLDPSKKSFKLALIDSPMEQLLEEIKKCQLLCRKCHHKKTLDKQEYGKESLHGTVWRYKKYRCRCDACKKAMSDYLASRS